MVTEKLISEATSKYLKLMDKAGIALSDEERNNVEICDYNLSRFDEIGTGIIIHVNTKRCCAKEIILYPWQICPEHIHPQLGDYPGKEETFRCRWGEVYLYVEGEPAGAPKAKLPADKEDTFTVWHEIILKPGEQYTLKEKTWHWFQAGPLGAVVSEFSTPSFDDKDIFRDQEITRLSNLK